jgi:hypothetical protein
LLALTILIAFAIGFGTPAADAEKMRLFSDAVDRWQRNPEFRKVQVEYVEMGSAAMRTRVCGVEATKGIMWLRSLPGLPEHLRVNDTSFAHYTNFTRGPLSAYMHLTSEQGLADTLKMLKDLGSIPNPTDADVVAFLKQYKLHNPVASDAGAVQSVRDLLADVDPARPLAIQTEAPGKLYSHISAMAAEMGFPPKIEEMTPAQQQEIWATLDERVRERDYELWRTKQVNDWLNGVWAQVYGTMYGGLINPMLTLREVARVAAPVMLMAWIGVAAYRRRRSAEQPQLSLQPLLAVDGPQLPPANTNPPA